MPGSATESFGRTLLLVAVFALLCAACDRTTEQRGERGNDFEQITTGPGVSTEETTGAAPVERVEVSTLVTNLDVPWSFAFLPDGDALVTERDSGRLLRISPYGHVREIQTLPEGGSGEGGLLGVAVSPNYEEDRYVYAYYTTETDNRVVRF
ncbi:MAG TPA: PQQ-dependent sugar dehydrogenase, partial [Rubrobacter sp.]|nr:PQQ-dependent sugar dehydrogenase [Rubrobacter sp.]